MNENDYNLICYNFQQKIIQEFNKSQLPFLVKFFLFQQVWETVKKQKIQNDYTVQSMKSKEVHEIPLDSFLKKEQNKKEKEE